MTVRPPQFTKRTDTDPLAAALEHEIFSEKAGTLARLNKKLEEALARLAAEECDAGTTEEAMQMRLAEAGEALWHVTIQRELCGLREHKAFYDFVGVSKAVRLRMGPASSLGRPGNLDKKESL